MDWLVRVRTSAIAVCLAAGLVPGAANCQQSAPELAAIQAYDLRALAEAEQGSRDCRSAVDKYRKVVALNPADGNSWLNLGLCLSKSGDPHAATEAYEKGVGLGFVYPSAGYLQLAKLHLEDGDRDGALAWLRRAIDSGYPHRLALADDPGLARLAQDPDFLRLVAAPKVSGADRVAGWLADLDWLTSEIKRVHYIYRNEPLPEDYRAGADAFRTSVAGWTDSRATIELLKLVATLHNGHSVLVPFGMQRGKLHVLQLQWYLFRDGLYILSSKTDADKLVGRRVTRIGALAPEDALRKAAAYMPRDGEQELKWFGPGWLQITEILYSVGLTDRPDRVTLTVESDHGHQQRVTVQAKYDAAESDFNVSLPPPPAAPAPLYLSHVDRNYWFTKTQPDVVYLQFNHVLNDEQEPLEVFSARLQDSLRDPGIHGLIVDVRLNNGGNASIIPPLLRTLTWFEREKGSGSLVVLIGRNTYSAAQNFTSYVNLMTKAIFVGEPTGSKPIHIGDEAEFTLPYSGLQGSIACYIHHDAIGRDSRVWIPPDAPVELTYEEYRRGLDPALSVAQSLLQRTRQALVGTTFPAEARR